MSGVWLSGLPEAGGHITDAQDPKSGEVLQTGEGADVKTRGLFNKKWRGLLITRLIARDGDRCGICAGKLDRYENTASAEAVTVDHVIPISHGGRSEMGNLRLAHRRCNQGRGDAWDPESDRIEGG